MFQPASWRQLRLRCGMITRVKPVLTVGGHQIKLHSVAYDITPPENEFVHEHSIYELIIFLEGNARYMWQAEDQTLGRGTIFLFPPQQRHAWRALGRCVKLVIMFSLDPAIAIPTPEAWPTSLALADEVESLAHELLEANPHELFFAPSRMISLVSRSLSILCPLPTAVAPYKHQSDLSEDIAHLVIHHLPHPLSLHEIAEQVGMSVRHLTRVFHQTAGETVSNFTMRTRLHHARFLLRETDKKVSEIGMLVGFQEQSYFFRCFRRYMGITPQQYRQMAERDDAAAETVHQ